jgi:type IV pilus assembly protein PilW
MTGPRTCRGFSLVELMVALALGMLLMSVLGTVLFGSLDVFRTQSENARLQEDSRFLLDDLGRQITQAGYTAISSDYADSRLVFGGVPIQGEHGVVAIRSGERKAGSAYLALSFDGVADCQGNPVATGTVVNEIYLSPADELLCATSGHAPVALASGVEAFLVRYGVDGNGDDNVDRYTVQPADWRQVRTVRLCLVLHAASLGTSPQAQRYQDCTGATVTAPDTRLRRVVGATYELRNRSP